MPDLISNGTPLQIGRTTLRTPGLAGSVTMRAAGPGGTRSTSSESDVLESVLAGESMQTQETIEIVGAREVPVGAGVTRSTALGQPAIEITVPDPGPDWEQVLLAVDESGVASWSIAAAGAPGEATRGGASRTYLVPRHVPPPAGPAETRGLLGAAAIRVLKVLVFPRLDPIAGRVGDALASRWEASKRPYRLRTFTPDDYTSSEVTPIEAGAWAGLAAGRALLLIHGPLGRTHSAFGALPPDFVQWLHERYEGRVIALDHPTLSADPSENAEWLLRQAPAGVTLDLDVIAHSRGGLVARVLAEQPPTIEGVAGGSDGAGSVRVNRVVFLGTPNAGTRLADPKHLGDLIDTATTIANLFPDAGASDVLATVITVVKQLAVGAAGGLPGLTAMAPDSAFLKALNGAPKAEATYRALAADFEPAPDSGLASYAADTLQDLILRGKNDLMVPTASVYEVEGSKNFPIQDRHVFQPADAVSHQALVRHPGSVERLRAWLA